MDQDIIKITVLCFHIHTLREIQLAKFHKNLNNKFLGFKLQFMKPSLQTIPWQACILLRYLSSHQNLHIPLLRLLAIISSNLSVRSPQISKQSSIKRLEVYNQAKGLNIYRRIMLINMQRCLLSRSQKILKFHHFSSAST